VPGVSTIPRPCDEARKAQKPRRANDGSSSRRAGFNANLVPVGPSLVERQLEAHAVPVRSRTVRHDQRTGGIKAGRSVTFSRVVTAPHAREAARDNL
jgi:hypothetical protein